MTTPSIPPVHQGRFDRVISRLARRRRRVLAIWLIVLVAALALFKTAGNDFSNSLTLPGTQSQSAVDALRHDFRSRAGDQDQIVFATLGSTLDRAPLQTRITSVLDRVSHLPHVVSVASPFGAADRSQVSPDRRVAFATITFDGEARSLPVSAIDAVISTVQSARARGLEVALGGQAIEHAEKPSLGPATAVGLIAAAIVLLLTFGSLVAMGLPIATALLGVGVGISLAGLLSHVIQIPDFATQLAAMIGLGVGIDYALFILTRYREDRRLGASSEAAITGAMDSAGRAVLFAGTTVILALLGQLVLGVGLLDGLAIASALVVTTTMLAALTALPALLTLSERRLTARPGRPARPARPARASGLRRPRRPPATGRWLRWSHTVARRPVVGAVAGASIMLLLAAPALSLRTGASDAGNDPAQHTTRQAFDLISRGFGPGANGPLSLVVRLPHAQDRIALGRVSSAVRSQPGIAAVSRPALSSDGRTAILDAYPRTAPQAAATTNLVNRLRASVLPQVRRATGATVLLGGSSAAAIDFSHVLASKLPLFIAVVLILSALLLTVAFRSVVIPIQAAVMNLLSIGASLGVTVAIFQWGWLGSLLDVTPGPVEGFIPEILFAIVFGLSMDYEVFLVSRIREHWLRHRDAPAAVHHGLATTGRLITAAATIMICVFASFALGDNRDIKLFGISMASAVFLDAFVVRSLLLPSVLHLLGPRTWWMPAWLNRHTPEIPLDREPGRLIPALEKR
jgi:RND superfamily putative drug exporter